MRFIRENAKKFHIDSSKIIASGGSAGGHLAAATWLIDGFNETTDNLKISSKPTALVLFNPVIDNGPGGYGYARIGDEYKNFSPLHNIIKGAPPTIIFLGTEDVYVPVETAKYYKTVMEKVGSRCDLFLYDGAKHTFFTNNKYYKEVLLEADKFLQSLGYLQENPKVIIE
jgi:acetyl esterase/lipase